MRDLGLKHPVSEWAQPMIRPDECANVETALCPRHGSRFLELNKPGQVYLCPHPKGMMYWRARAGGTGMYGPMKFPKGL